LPRIEGPSNRILAEREKVAIDASGRALSIGSARFTVI